MSGEYSFDVCDVCVPGFQWIWNHLLSGTNVQARRYFEPRIPRVRFFTRRACAVRLVGYMRSLQSFGRTQAAIVRVKSALALIQRLWKDAAVIRHHQRDAFLDQLVAFEGRMLRANQYKCAPHACITRSQVRCLRLFRA